MHLVPTVAKKTKTVLDNIQNPSKFRKEIVQKLNKKAAEKLEQHKKNVVKKMFNEGALDTLTDIVGAKGRKAIKFKNGQQLTVDLQTANMLLTVYNALLKPDAKAKFENMLGSDPASFMRLVDFGWKQVK